MSLSERDRDSLINYIVELHRATDLTGGLIARAELPALPELLAELEKSATTFIKKVRMLNP